MTQIDQAISALQDIVKALHDGDNTNTVLVIATIVLAIATIGFGLWDRTRQNTERFERVRPWITLEHAKPAQVFFSNGESLLWDRFRSRDPSDRREPVKITCTIKYTNTGLRPALNLARKDYGGFTSITKQEFLAKQEELMDIDLGPNSEQFIPFTMGWGDWLESENRPLFMALSLSYDNGKTRSHSGIICRVKKTFSEILSSWYD